MKTLKTLILAIVCLFATAAMAQQPQSKGQMNAQKLATTLYLIENFYVDTANIDKVTEDAIIAALKELDPHSAYISKKDVEKANEPLVGSFEGIGVTFQLIRDTISATPSRSSAPWREVRLKRWALWQGTSSSRLTAKKPSAKKWITNMCRNTCAARKARK